MKSFPIRLSRLAITGIINNLTPLVVLKEILEAHWISYDENKMDEPRYLTQLINEINTKNVKVIKEPYDMQNYRSIARFVNKNMKWKKGSLNQAFQLLLEYTKIEKLCEPHIDFNYGLQTPEHPENLNACVLYGICQANRIDTCFNTTMEELAANIKLLFRLSNEMINHSVRETIYNTVIYEGCDNYQLINILTQIDPEKSLNILKSFNNNDNEMIHIMGENPLNNNNNVIDYDSLSDAGSSVRLRNIRIRPHTRADAIAMAAIYYKIDITQVKNPLAEYQELTRTPYFPIENVGIVLTRSPTLNPVTSGAIASITPAAS